MRLHVAALLALLLGCGSSHGPGDRDAGPGDSGSGADASPGVDSGATICTNDLPCTGGAICTGGGCENTWVCMHTTTPCTDDLAPYCGCDGETFHDSSSCPTQPFAYRGECRVDDGVNCDSRTVTCRAFPPDCAEGQVPSVVASCWGDCVPIESCRCETADNCPMPEIYTCHGTTNRCGPYL